MHVIIRPLVVVLLATYYVLTIPTESFLFLIRAGQDIHLAVYLVLTTALYWKLPNAVRRAPGRDGVSVVLLR